MPQQSELTLWSSISLAQLWTAVLKWQAWRHDGEKKLLLFPQKFHHFLKWNMCLFLWWNYTAVNQCLYTQRTEIFLYLYLFKYIRLHPVKYIAQSAATFIIADLIEYCCFSDVLLFPLACLIFITLFMLCSLWLWAQEHYSSCFDIASYSSIAILTYLTLTQAKLNHQ